MAAGRVLVVDDEQNLRKSLQRTLTKAGYDVVEAEDGAQGMEVIKAGDNPLNVDVIICDVNMPKVGGREAISMFRAQFPSVPIIVLTGDPKYQDAAEFLKTGASEYLAKPFNAEDLVKKVGECVKKHVFHH
jgi:two-component system, chemotaxis family, chemotaxis protein CheY